MLYSSQSLLVEQTMPLLYNTILHHNRLLVLKAQECHNIDQHHTVCNLLHSVYQWHRYNIPYHMGIVWRRLFLQDNNDLLDNHCQLLKWNFLDSRILHHKVDIRIVL